MMGMLNKKYKDDYETILINEEGREKKLTVYRGPYYEIDLDQAGLTRFRRDNLLLLIFIVVLHLAAGFVNNPGMYQFYIALPYVIALLPLWNILSAILRIPKLKEKYHRDEVEPSFDHIGNSSIWLMLCFGISLLGELVYMLFFSGGERLGSEFLFFLPELLAAAALYFMIRLQKQVKIRLLSGG